MAEKKRTKPTASTRVTTLRLDPEVHRRARMYALAAGSSLQAVVSEALSDYLKKRGA